MRKAPSRLSLSADRWSRWGCGTTVSFRWSAPCRCDTNGAMLLFSYHFVHKHNKCPALQCTNLVPLCRVRVPPCQTCCPAGTSQDEPSASAAAAAASWTHTWRRPARPAACWFLSARLSGKKYKASLNSVFIFISFSFFFWYFLFFQPFFSFSAWCRFSHSHLLSLGWFSELLEHSCKYLVKTELLLECSSTYRY